MTDHAAPDLAQAQICALPPESDRASQGANLPLATEDAARDRVRWGSSGRAAGTC